MLQCLMNTCLKSDKGCVVWLFTPHVAILSRKMNLRSILDKMQWIEEWKQKKEDFQVQTELSRED